MSRSNILIVDDETSICSQIAEILEEEGYGVATAPSAAAARQVAREQDIDLALVDIWMPGEDGLSLLKFWQRTSGASFPVLVMSGHGNITTAIEAIQLGAAHFLEKPLNFQTLILEVKRTLEVSRLRQENQQMTRDFTGQEQLVGNHPEMEELRKQAHALSLVVDPVLIVGEDGCEHRALAAMIHRNSPRSAGPFINNNQTDPEASSNEDHVTIAHFLKKAEGGTLFVNSIDQLSEAEQKELLDVLSEGSGSDDENPRAGIRVIATLREVPARSKKGKTPYAKLMARFSDAVLTIPPLRDRTQDIPDLVEHFMYFYCTQENLTWRAMTPPILQILESHSWPGNVQELRHCIHHLLNGTHESPDILPEELNSILYPRMLGKLITRPYREAHTEFDRSYFDFHLQQSEGNVAHLSSRTGMERTYLYRKLQELGLRSGKSSKGKPSSSS